MKILLDKVDIKLDDGTIIHFPQREFTPNSYGSNFVPKGKDVAVKEDIKTKEAIRVKIKDLEEKIKNLKAEELPKLGKEPRKPGAIRRLDNLNAEEGVQGKKHTTLNEFYKQCDQFDKEDIQTYTKDMVEYYEDPKFAKHSKHNDTMKTLQHELAEAKSFLSPVLINNIIIENSDLEIDKDGNAKLSEEKKNIKGNTDQVKGMSSRDHLDMLFETEEILQIQSTLSAFNALQGVCNDFLGNPYLSKDEHRFVKECKEILVDDKKPLMARFNAFNEKLSSVPSITISESIKNFFHVCGEILKNIFKLNFKKVSSIAENYNQSRQERVNKLKNTQLGWKETISNLNQEPEPDFDHMKKPGG